MTAREGTVRLAGLFEGPAPPEGEAALRDWIDRARGRGLSFDLSLDGALFSLIPHSEEPFDWRGVAPVEDTLRDLLDSLLASLPETSRLNCMSTLRSVEVIPGAERQTLYTLGGDGRIRIEQREVDADTRPPPAPPDPGKLLRRAGIGVLAAAVLFLATTPFVPYGDWVRRARSNLVRTPAADIEVDPGPYTPFLREHRVEWDRKRGEYRVVLLWIDGWDAAAVEDAWFRSESLPEKLALEDLARGRMRVEARDGEGVVLSRSTEELRPVEEAPEDGTPENASGVHVRPRPRLRRILLGV